MSAFTPQHAAVVDPLVAAGATKQAMLRALEAAGCPLNYRTLRKYLGAAPAPTPPAPGSLAASVHASRAARAAEVAEAELAPDDDLGRLARRRDQIDQALDGWQDQIAINPTAVRAYRALAAELATLTRALVELRPRPEAEAERLAALGSAARAEVLERARAAASPDDVSELRRKLADQERALVILRKVLADGD